MFKNNDMLNIKKFYVFLLFFIIAAVTLRTNVYASENTASSSEVNNVSASSAKDNSIDAVKISKVDASKQNKITISWSKVPGADGYDVYKASSKNGSYTKVKTVGSGTAKYTLTVGNGKTIYVKVRAFKNSNSQKVCGPFSTAKKAVEIGATWYKKVLSSKSASYNVRYQYDHIVQTKRVYRKDYPYYKLTDINKDGIKELILHTDISSMDDENRILLLTYYGGKVKPLLSFGGAYQRGRFYITGKNLAVVASGSDFSYNAYFTVSKGKLKKVRDMRYYNNKYTRPYKQYYYVNGKETTATAWSNAVKKYFPSSLKKLTYTRIS